MHKSDIRKLRCNQCGEKFESEGLPPMVCPNCQDLRDTQYYVVRELVREFPGITALEVHDFTEVPMEDILRYVDKGMLEVIPTDKRDGKITERIERMMKRAKERKKLYEQQQKGEVVEKLDVLGEDEKFKWIAPDENSANSITKV